MARRIEMKLKLSTTDRRLMARRLQQARRSMGLTQTQAAKRLRIGAMTLANYEQARIELPLALLPRVARLYRTRPDELIFGIAPPAKELDLESREQVEQMLEGARRLIADVQALMGRLEQTLKRRERITYLRMPPTPKPERVRPARQAGGGPVPPLRQKHLHAARLDCLEREAVT
jgi:transcriptional regulator with XRE-family HTH domain